MLDQFLDLCEAAEPDFNWAFYTGFEAFTSDSVFVKCSREVDAATNTGLLVCLPKDLIPHLIRFPDAARSLATQMASHTCNVQKGGRYPESLVDLSLIVEVHQPF